MAIERASFPVVPRWGENEELVRILIHEDWFDHLLPLFRIFRLAGGVATIESIPNELAQALRKPLELISSLTAEFGVLGWTFSLSLIYLMQWAASEVVTVGKFVYEEAGGYGRAGYGEGGYGMPIEIVKEITE